MQREDYQRYNRFKWVLWLVIISFVVWGAGTFREKDIRLLAARVGDREITREDFIDAYKRQYEIYQQFAKDNPKLLEGLPRQTLNGLVNQKLMLLLAERHGFTAAPEEIADRIKEIFKDESGFVGPERYRAILRDRLRTTAANFEARLGEEIVAEKFQNLIEDVTLVSEQDARREFEADLSVRFDWVKTDAGKFTAQIAVAEEEMKAHYEANKDSFRAPEKRRVQLALLRPADFMDKIPVSDGEIAALYERDRETNYKQPEERRVSQILFKIEGQDPQATADAEAALRPKAEAVLARAKAGEDFAALAREFSDDPSGAQGGDLGYIPRGRKSVLFEEKAFSMQVGEISDHVRTEEGLHIIKLVDIKASGYRSLDEVRSSIESSIKRPKAEELAQQRAEELKRMALASSLEAAAKELAIELRDSGFFGKDDPIQGVGRSEELAGAAFSAKPGMTSDVIPIVPSFLRLQQSIKVSPQGFAVFGLTETRPSQIPPFEEARPEVEKALRQKKAKELAKQEVAELDLLLQSPKSPDEWKAALEAKGYTTQDSGTIGSRASLPGIADSTALVRKAWSGKPGDYGRHEIADGSVVYYQVLERRAFDPAEFATERKGLQDNLAAQRRSALLQSILESAKETYDIELNQDLLKEFESS